MAVPSEVRPMLECENSDRGPVYVIYNGRYRRLADVNFPCRYRENGCLSKVPFAQKPAHEKSCLYRKHACPIADIGQCEWTGIRTQLLEHCRQDHPDNVVQNPCKFTHNITRSSLHNYLLWTFGVLFLIQTKVCTATRKIYHSVRLISDLASASNYKYTLCIQNKDSRFYKDRQVASREWLALQNDSSIQTDIDALLTMLEDFTDTTFTVTVESVGNATTTESSTTEPSSEGTSTANTLSITDQWRLLWIRCYYP